MAQKRFLNITSFFCGLLAGFAVLFILNTFFNSSAKNENLQDDLLAIYGVDAKEVLHKEYCFYVNVQKSIPLIERLQLFADKISTFEFSNRPITVANIKLQNGKEIAIIDLHDSPSLSQNENSWYERFQGSTGGVITETVLIKSFLQHNYQGQWIDGVEFLYNGKPFHSDQWDHIHLEGTLMRDGTRILRDGTVQQIYPIYQQFPPS